VSKKNPRPFVTRRFTRSQQHLTGPCHGPDQFTTSQQHLTGPCHGPHQFTTSQQHVTGPCHGPDQFTTSQQHVTGPCHGPHQFTTSQQHVTGPCHGPHQFTPQPHMAFLVRPNSKYYHLRPDLLSDFPTSFVLVNHFFQACYVLRLSDPLRFDQSQYLVKITNYEAPQLHFPPYA